MSEPANDVHRFRVRARHQDVHHGRIVSESTFEAAALAYAEHLPLDADQHDQVAVIVRDLSTGHEHSFLINIDSGTMLTRV